MAEWRGAQCLIFKNNLHFLPVLDHRLKPTAVAEDFRPMAMATIYKFTKTKIKSFECPKSIRNYKKNNAWNIRH